MKRLTAVLALLAPALALAQDTVAVTAPPATLGTRILAEISPYLATLIAGGLVWLCRWGAAALKANAQGSAVAAVAAKALHLVEVTVSDLEATVKVELAKAREDGVITAEEGKHLREVAIARAKQLLGEHGLKEITGVMGVAGTQLDGYLGGLVEKAVARVSTETTITTTTSPQ